MKYFRNTEWDALFLKVTKTVDLLITSLKSNISSTTTNMRSIKKCITFSILLFYISLTASAQYDLSIKGTFSADPGIPGWNLEP